MYINIYTCRLQLVFPYVSYVLVKSNNFKYTFLTLSPPGLDAHNIYIYIYIYMDTTNDAEEHIYIYIYIRLQLVFPYVSYLLVKSNKHAYTVLTLSPSCLRRHNK
jgi:hypothetical protein